MKAIEINDLTKFYGKSRGITNVNLTVEEGEFFGFIGPNGAGKSTTIRTLLGLISATSGSASIFGKDIVKNKTEILADVGYLPSETMFYNGMKVKDILKLSESLRGIDCKKEAEELCTRLELDVNKKVNELSLGNRKKLGIVCAMQHKPKLYILDEPTSGLDPLIQKEFYDILTKRNQEGATVFLSSHVLSEIGKYCRRAAVIREGKILACDSIEKLGHTDVKRVVLRGTKEFVSNEEIIDIKQENDIVSFLYKGSAKELTSLLCKLDFEDFTVSDIDLEEGFMHFYAKEEN
ncbi:MAG: ABC transporter ATP-binding protein [Clostridia bacterium]|nr:ABC transporter ATP-binding protein [Clostridia bacterium]